MIIKKENNRLTIKLNEEDVLMGELSPEEIEDALLGKGYGINISDEQAETLNAEKELEIELEQNKENSENEEVNVETQHQGKPFDNKGIYGENISSRFEFLNRGTERVWEVLGDYLDRGFLITNIVVARQWCSYRCDFTFRNNEIFRDCYKVRGEEISLLRMIANDSYPDKSGCDGRRVLNKKITKLDGGAIGITLLVEENIELKIVMDKIY